MKPLASLCLGLSRDILEPTVTPEDSDNTPIFPPMSENRPADTRQAESSQQSEAQAHPPAPITNGTQSTSSQEGKILYKS